MKDKLTDWTEQCLFLFLYQIKNDAHCPISIFILRQRKEKSLRDALQLVDMANFFKSTK